MPNILYQCLSTSRPSYDCAPGVSCSRHTGFFPGPQCQGFALDISSNVYLPVMPSLTTSFRMQFHIPFCPSSHLTPLTYPIHIPYLIFSPEQYHCLPTCGFHLFTCAVSLSLLKYQLHETATSVCLDHCCLPEYLEQCLIESKHSRSICSKN